MTAIVTGAAGIVGRAVFDAFKAAGRAVVGVDLVEATPNGVTLQDYIGGVDLTNEASASQLAEIFKERDVTIDALVNIAGGFVWVPVMDAGNDIWAKMIAINLMTTLNCSKAIIPLMPAGSSIVNIGAAAADKGSMGMGPYVASKAAVIRLSETLADELRGQGIRVNVVSPTIVDTPQNRKDMPDAAFTDWVAPGQIADLILFLTSDAASAINGANIKIAGKV